MTYDIARFKKSHIVPAVDLFFNTYRGEMKHSPLLPKENLEKKEYFRDLLVEGLDKFGPESGVAVMAAGRFAGFMLTGAKFRFKGLDAVQVREYGHASVEEDKSTIYHLMYMKLAQTWSDMAIPLHVIGHFAHDVILKERLYKLGFGAIIAENLMELREIDTDPEIRVEIEDDVKEVVDIHFRHFRKYYTGSPIFITKDSSQNELRQELEEGKEAGDVILTSREKGVILGYTIVGQSEKGFPGSAGFLLQNTNTAQIKSAYVKDEYRRGGLGAAMLNAAIRIAKERKFERLFVEHETANYYGGRFWGKYFEPFVYFSMRYVDKDLVEAEAARKD